MMNRLLSVLCAIGFLCQPCLTVCARADDAYKAQLPEDSIYRAMLSATRQTGWIQFRNYDGQQLIYFTQLQTMHCRLSEIRFSINSDALDQRWPLAACNPQLPFNLPSDDPDGKYIYMRAEAGSVKTLTIQVVWDNGAGSEIVVYKPCDTAGDATCAAIETIKMPEKRPDGPRPSKATR
jgi:hypothetical protein